MARYGGAVAAVAAALGVRLVLQPFIVADVPFLVFFAAVMVSAAWGGLGPGVLATGLSCLAADYFFLEPKYEVFSGTLAQNLPLALFAVEGALVSGLAEWLRIALRRSEEDGDRLREEMARRQRSEEELDRHRRHLEDLVRQRTSDLERTTTNLRRSNQDLEQFAHVASHDLKEPLRMVTGFMGLLKERYRDRLDAQAGEFIEFAVGGATRMQRLIDDLLAYARVGRNTAVESVDAGVALDAALQNLRAALDESGARIVREPLPAVKANAVELAQVFQNLIGNALKFRTPDVTPEVRVAAAKVKADDTVWLFSVRDNGIGIDPACRHKLFEVFQRLHTREEYAGTGVGLAICKKAVERLGGKIWVESEPGHGATFFFTLPEPNRPGETSL